MTQEFKNMMHLLGCASLGSTLNCDITSDYDVILEKAREQGIFHLVFASLKLLHKKGEIKLDNYEKINSQVMISCNRNACKIAAFNEVIKEFENRKISYAVLKGDTLSTLYKFPAMRISGDIDILVDEDRESDVLKIMSEFGFSYSPRSKSANHTECRHPVIGLVEVHISLYYDFMTSVWFNGHRAEENFRKVKLSDDNECFTLSINDGYVYLILHAVKHFLSNGLTLKQIMDIVLYTANYFKDIDFVNADKLFTKLKYKKFVDCLYYIGQKYWGINLFNIDNHLDIVCEEILSDCENSGAFGIKKSMGDFYELYNEIKLKEKGSIDFVRHMTKWRRDNLKDYLSLTKRSMNEKYPHLGVWRARITHLKNVLHKMIKQRKKIHQFVKYKPIADEIKGTERMKLIKDLDMI
ncbi:MAG: nucleotidyltransferase family protein [Clostridia bacterium]|nr:nucleotidyltransferase family protein [Clostridia bacterium]